MEITNRLGPTLNATVIHLRPHPTARKTTCKVSLQEIEMVGEEGVTADLHRTTCKACRRRLQRVALKRDLSAAKAEAARGARDREIVDLRATGERLAAIAKEFGLSPSSIWRICRGKR